jgi:hypothetical protein
VGLNVFAAIMILPHSAFVLESPLETAIDRWFIPVKIPRRAHDIALSRKLTHFSKLGLVSLDSCLEVPIGHQQLSNDFLQLIVLFFNPCEFIPATFHCYFLIRSSGAITRVHFPLVDVLVPYSLVT